MPPPLPPTGPPPPFPPAGDPTQPAGAPIPPKKSNAVVIAVVIAAVVFGVIVVVAILAALAFPAISAATQRGRATMAMNNARQIHLATMRMALDNEAEPNPALGWPGDLAANAQQPIRTQGEFVERLVKFEYLSRGDLTKLFLAPNVQLYTGEGEFKSDFSPFKIYKVTAKDEPNTLFLATRNFSLGSGLDAGTQPFGSKIGVLCLKDGTGKIVNPRQAQQNELGGLLPGQAAGDGARAETQASTLE